MINKIFPLISHLTHNLVKMIRHLFQVHGQNRDNIELFRVNRLLCFWMIRRNNLWMINIVQRSETLPFIHVLCTISPVAIRIVSPNSLGMLTYKRTIRAILWTWRYCKFSFKSTPTIRRWLNLLWRWSWWIMGSYHRIWLRYKRIWYIGGVLNPQRGNCECLLCSIWRH